MLGLKINTANYRFVISCVKEHRYLRGIIILHTRNEEEKKRREEEKKAIDIHHYYYQHIFKVYTCGLTTTTNEVKHTTRIQPLHSIRYV